MKLQRNVVVLVSVLVVSLVLSLFVLYTPVVPYNPFGSDFSAVRVATDIGNISREPHSTNASDAAAHEAVRQYVIDSLSKSVGAANVTTQDYETVDDVFGTIPLHNVLAKIPGKSDTAILLVAHYDSRGYIGRIGELAQSFGAADDGYGVGVLLEIARLYGGRTLENPVWILVTDGEETGMYGAMKAAQEPWMAQVGLVVNIEARGTSGPAYMFETGKGNSKVIDFYAKAGLPVSYSLATAVYSVMPNATDFTEFVQAGKTGVNFAVLEGLKYYHAPGDQLSHISLTSLQHYGAQIVPLVEEFATNAKYADPSYFLGASDQVFFTLFPNVFVHYPESTGLILDFVAAALLLALLVLLVLRKAVRLKAYLLGLVHVLLALVGAGLVGYLASRLIAWLGKVPWKITYVRLEGTGLPTVLVMLAVVAALYFFLRKAAPKAEDRRAFLLAGATWNVLLAILTGFALSGASFLFLVPAALAVVSIALATFVRGSVMKHVALSQNLLWNLLLLVPILYSLFIALTVGGLLALLVILVLYASVMVPSAMLQAEKD